MTVGEQIKIERERQGLSQEQLGELINSNPQDISRWENGGGMTVKSLEKICKMLNMRVIVGE